MTRPATGLLRDGLATFLLVVVSIAGNAWRTGTAWASKLQSETQSQPNQKANPNAPIKLPDGWDPADPIPLERTNCVRCHITAGRELTLPVRDFARSVHDRARLSCDDCHGGNTEDDSKAHEDVAGFIGTKLSAHMTTCAECHVEEAAALRNGPHYWDHSKRVNPKFPLCIDCHGNHDVGKPPAEFSLMNVCSDCHKDFADKYPLSAAVVNENDRLWVALRGRELKPKLDVDPMAASLERELAVIRRTTARLFHPAREPTNSRAEAINRRARELTKLLERQARK